MKPKYVEGEPVGLHHLLADWIAERHLPVQVMQSDDDKNWYLVGESTFTAEVDGQTLFGWEPAFKLNAADPDFFPKLEAIILSADDGELDL